MRLDVAACQAFQVLVMPLFIRGYMLQYMTVVIILRATGHPGIDQVPGDLVALLCQQPLFKLYIHSSALPFYIALIIP